MKQQLERDVRDMLTEEPSAANIPEAIDLFVDAVAGKVDASMQKLIAETQEKMSAVTGVLPS